MSTLSKRLTSLENAYQETLSRTLALETLCIAMLPTVCQASDQLEAILDTADEALHESLQADGCADAFTDNTLEWFRRMRADAVFIAEQNHAINSPIN